MHLRNLSAAVVVAQSIVAVLATAPAARSQEVVRVAPAQPASGQPVAESTVVQPTTLVTQPAMQPMVAQPQPQPAYYYGDPYGFTGWLNATRAQYGLPAVGYDPNLSAWASQNNAQQNARGMGHHVMGPARRQNSAMGGYASVPGMWMASPAHRAALLDPTIRFIGIAGAGAYWTFNAY